LEAKEDNNGNNQREEGTGSNDLPTLAVLPKHAKQRVGQNWMVSDENERHEVVVPNP
jgi:hypothetical protein